jgi:SAM-dependent methyltransferase
MDAPTNRRGWAERVGRFSPTYYAELGPNKVSRSLATVADHFLDADGAILEVGCSSGRHLAHLRRQGYDCLTGVDINDESFDVMAEYFPALAATGTFHTGPIEDVLPAFDTGRFDMVYSVETLQHVHPDSVAVFGDLARVTDGVLVTVENEGDLGEEGANEDADGADGDADGASGSKDRDGDESVRFVDGEFPLYRRHWGEVFTAHGLTQLRCQPSRRDTIRVFR